VVLSTNALSADKTTLNLKVAACIVKLISVKAAPLRISVMSVGMAPLWSTVIVKLSATYRLAHHAFSQMFALSAPSSIFSSTIHVFRVR
jgi:hypothetical protein